MAEVKKRSRAEVEASMIQVPTMEERRKPIYIKVGKKKKYLVPDVTVRTRTRLFDLQELLKTDAVVNERDSMNYVVDYIYEILRDEYPELKKEDLDEMPVWQTSFEFYMKLEAHINAVPLDSEETEVEQ